MPITEPAAAIVDVSPAIVSFLLTYLLHSTVILGLVWLAVKLVPLRLSALRDAMWKVALVGGLASAAIQVTVDFHPVSGRFEFDPVSPVELTDPGENADVAPPPRAARGAGERLNVDLVPVLPGGVPVLVAAERTPVRRNTTSARAVRVHAEEPEDVATASLLTAVVDRARGVGGYVSRVWPVMLVGVWLGWSLVLLTRLLLLRRRLGAALSSRTDIPEGPITALADRLARRAAFDRRIKLSTCPAISVPIAYGRREIVLPERALTELDADQLAGLIGHEIAHLVRRDPRWLAVCAVIERVFFFQPLNRVARAGVQESAEYLCDDLSARLNGGGVPLARCLADVASWMVPSRTSVLVSGVLDGGRSQLVNRVRMLVADRGTGLPRMGRWSRVALLGAFTVLISLSVPAIGKGLIRLPRDNGGVDTAGATEPATMLGAAPARPAIEVGDEIAVSRDGRDVEVTVNGDRLPADRVRTRGDRVDVLDASGDVMVTGVLAEDDDAGLLLLDQGRVLPVAGSGKLGYVTQWTRGEDDAAEWEVARQEYEVQQEQLEQLYGLLEDLKVEMDESGTTEQLSRSLTDARRAYERAMQMAKEEDLHFDFGFDHDFDHEFVFDFDRDAVGFVQRDDFDGRADREFFSAVASGDLDVLEELIADDKQAIDMRGPGQITPLMLGVSEEEWDAVLLLLDSGAAVNLADERGRTAMHVAAAEAGGEMVELLAEFGGDIHAIDDRGRTPLHYAAGEGDVDAVLALIDLGADPSREDDRGRTPRDYAERGDEDEVVDLIEEMAGR